MMPITFLREKDGQDLSEYCLLMALIALIALGVFIHVSGGIGSIWADSGSALATANGTVSGSTSGEAPASSPSAPTH